MVNSISQAQPSKNTKTSIFYINDVHSNIINLEKLKSASDSFDSFTPSEKTDKLKFSAGDIGVGRDYAFNKLGLAFQNITGIMASAGGNHEFDLRKGEIAEVLKDAKFKMLGANADIPLTTEDNKHIRERMLNSYVQEQNGTKYGVIGLMPFDFEFHLSDPDEYKDFKIKQPEETFPIIQKEIDKFKEQGIDKIILLSHCGYADDVNLAKNVEGIDVIIGGHTHDLIKDIKEGKNLFYSKKTGEPTIITQAGKNGEHYGVLNLEFNEKGVITKAQNNVMKTEGFGRNMVMKFFTDKLLGKPNVVGTVTKAPIHNHDLITENPTANFLADAEKSELGVDMVLINAANIRSNIEPGKLTDRDLKTITPFDNKVWILRLTEKDVVDALKVGAKSLISIDTTPGILQISGLKYTMSKSGDLKAATFVDAKGQEFKINVENPSTTKTYSVAVDDYIAKGGNDYLKGKTPFVERKLNYDKNVLVIDYLKKHPEPIELPTEKRISIVD